jgi:uroporphyrinogen III methyltransferase/synthase
LQRLFGDNLTGCRFAAISSVTAKVLQDHGHRVEAIATRASMEGLVDAIRDAVSAGCSDFNDLRGT